MEFELEALEGLADVVGEEAHRAGVRVLTRHDDGVRVRAAADAGALLALRTASSVSLRLGFGVPRPKALLGDEHLRRLLTGIEEVRARAPEPFEGFRFAAAGRDSAVFRRLASAVASSTGLDHRPEDGTLLLRVRPDPHGRGWEALIRLTPRPSSARPWRVCNRPGGLNAALAAAMVRLAGVGRSQRVLNLMCGSGTLLVERALAGPAARLVGVDVDPSAIACARANLAAAGVDAELACSDVRATGLEPASFDLMLLDLPWGGAVGTHRANASLHPEVLRSAARLCPRGGRLVVLTHELRLMDALLPTQRAWRPEADRQVAHGGHHPRLLLLSRTAEPAEGDLGASDG